MTRSGFRASLAILFKERKISSAKLMETGMEIFQPVKVYLTFAEEQLQILHSLTFNNFEVKLPNSVLVRSVD